MNEPLIYIYGKDNIFDFMNDFTTILSMKDQNINTESIQYEDEDDFFCISEKKTYSEKELFEKFNILKVVQ